MNRQNPLMRLRLAALVAASVLLGLPVSAQSQGPTQPYEVLPLWEIGVGGAARYGSEYLGSSETGAGLSPLPFLTYRSRLLNFGPPVAPGTPYRDRRLEFGVSVDAAPALDSGDNAARAGMDDLPTLVEFGPEAIVQLAETAPLFGDQTYGRIEFITQARGVFDISDEGVGYTGFVVRPALRYRQNGSLRPGSRVQASIGPIFATEGVHDHYYEVRPGEATADRPAFDAVGGYLGTKAQASFRYPLNNRLRLVGGVSATYLGGVANERSSLIEEDIAASAFIGLTVSLFQSKAKARRDR